ncbi:cation transporter [Methylomicrobium sp. Wu6]|uniref:cation transporter n=1 Tax=Methylomicrobium sp. Wu6 TaxID=3107928 RepID=UPI002DD6AB84|nr:cation transporter [Methylomicrobium sp. Wu6]MEC4750523.1 cation transporter [Methylomicrobium sp. Wu6]
MKTKILLCILAFVVKSGSVLAESRMVTLDVQNMTCAVCPITVKKALEHISAVRLVSVDYASKTVTVQFDDTMVTTNKLTEATKAAGYPSSIKKAN